MRKGLSYLKSSKALRSEITSDLLKLLQHSSFFENSCKIILEKLCSFSGSNVACIAVINESKGDITSYEYAAGIDKLFEYHNAIEEARSLYSTIAEQSNRTGMAYYDSKTVSEGCIEDFKKIGYKGCIISAVKIEGRTSAYIIIASNEDNCEWSDNTIGAVQDFGKIIAGLWQNQSSQDELHQTLKTFRTVLDNIDTCVFVCEKKSGLIIYSNRRFSDLCGENVISRTPSDILGDDFLPDCDDATAELKGFEYYHDNTKQWFDVTFATISWTDGSTVLLTTLYDISDKVEYEKAIERQALFDQLTGLPNRRKLERDFSELVKIRKDREGSWYVISIDLDDFKNLNDTRGHHHGDAHLKRVADFLREFRDRGCDVYRIGGDEFVVITAPDTQDRINAVLKELSDGFNREWQVDANSYYLTASMGITEITCGEDAAYSEVMKQVDMAVFQAKKLGKNNAVKYHSDIGENIYRHIEIKRSMISDVRNNFRNFEVRYQPIINSDTEKIEGCEALLRWKCDKFGPISPGEFIPVAESNGLINQIGEFVLKSAALQCRKWIDMGHSLRVNVNLSIEQLNQPDFPEKVREIINDTAVPSGNLMLEVTESMAINDMNRMKDILNEFYSYGIHIALDDFGTGYSSLNCLKEMPLNTIKIDKTFIDDIVENPSTIKFLRTIVSLSHDLNMTVCAEGVEHREQFDLLKGLNIDVIQGFYFGRPISSKEFEKKFLEKA